MTDIQVDVIQTSIREEISEFLRSRIRWRTIGIYMETTSKLMLGCTSIIAFATSIYPCNSYLSFIAGTVSTLSLVSLQFANYSFRESKLSTENLNILLSKMNVESVPDLNGSVLKDSPLGLITTSHKPESASIVEEKQKNLIAIDIIPQLHLPETTIISTEILTQI